MITTKTAVISLLSDDILLVKFNQTNEIIDIEEAKKQFESAEKLTEGKKMKVLVDATESMQQMSKEAKEYLVKITLKKAEAILVKAIHQRLIATFFINMVEKKQSHPVKVFSDREKAIQWLKETGN